MLHIRNQHKTFGRGKLEFIKMPGFSNGQLLSFIRSYQDEEWLVIHNLTDHVLPVTLPESADRATDIFSGTKPDQIEPYGFCWLQIS